MIEELLAYYKQNKRDLPWRKNQDPYRVWISEIMCQQTQVAMVIPYFNRFMECFPTISSLAQCDDDTLMKCWQGLGYYSRARNLKKAALTIVEKFNGVFPEKYEDILSLSGIGDYTACAIASMAFNRPYVSIDGNFFRVFSRFYANADDIALPATKENLKKKLLSMSIGDYGEFNQAVMDLGATVCLFRKPLCERCPLATQCEAHAQHAEEKYPYKSVKTKVRVQNITVFIIHTEKGYLIRKREQKGLLGGLYEFVNVKEKLSSEEIESRYPDARVQFCQTATHHFSHITWEMSAYLVEKECIDPDENELLVSAVQLTEKIPMAKAFNRFWDLLKQEK